VVKQYVANMHFFNRKNNKKCATTVQWRKKRLTSL